MVGTVLAPVLFRLVAPWVGAAWQCVCLGGILALYATTPADAIRLPRWVSKVVIVGGMVAIPALCYGRMTWALVVAPLVVLVFDHLPLRLSRPEGKKRDHITARWSWRPGIASDWLAAIVLWSPTSWIILEGGPESSLPEWAIPASIYCLLFTSVLQLCGRAQAQARPRIPERVGMALVFWALGVAAVVGYAVSPEMSG